MVTIEEHESIMNQEIQKIEDEFEKVINERDSEDALNQKIRNIENEKTQEQLRDLQA